jgi:hypothetical protein
VLGHCRGFDLYVDHPLQRFRCKDVKMDKVEMSAVRVTAGDGTTHAEPRRAARLFGSATTSLVRVPRAVAVSARLLACGAPPVSSGGRESSKTTRESQTLTGEGARIKQLC